MVFYFYNMEIRSTNLAVPRKVVWRGKEITTGIFKSPVAGPVFLGKETVKDDTVADRKVHGGIDKACYLFSSGQYDFWKGLYPKMDWKWGMFGENLTVDGLNEDSIYIGNIYEIGTALVQVSQPREPCFKLGIRFGSQDILKQFIDRAYPGTYVRVLQQGSVMPGDKIKLVETSPNTLTVKDFFHLTYSVEKDPHLLNLALTNESLPQKKRDTLSRFIKKGGS